jgi:hypothetical protein
VPRFHRTWPDGCRIKETDGCLLFLLSTGMALPACYVVAPVDSVRTGFPFLCVVLYRISNQNKVSRDIINLCCFEIFTTKHTSACHRFRLRADDVRFQLYLKYKYQSVVVSYDLFSATF